MKEYPFNTAYTHLKTFYGTEITPDDFETIGLSAWDKIGNKRSNLYKYKATPVEDEGGWYINLPCNVDFIEAVTTSYEDYQETYATKSDGDTTSEWIEGYIENRKMNTPFLNLPGKFVKYRVANDKLYVAQNYSDINVLYKGVILDEEGLPSLTESEVDAVAVFCAYSKTFKNALVTKDPRTMQLAAQLKNDWLTRCTQARVPDHLSQNDFDEILNASTSWDRKRFGKSFKPFK
jgi:hypothetical protein